MALYSTKSTEFVCHTVRHHENQVVSNLRGRRLDLPVIHAIAMGGALMRYDNITMRIVPIGHRGISRRSEKNKEKTGVR